MDLSMFTFVEEHLLNMSKLDFGLKDDQDSAIPFQKSKAPILIVAGEDDQFMPSSKVVIFLKSFLKIICLMWFDESF